MNAISQIPYERRVSDPIWMPCLGSHMNTMSQIPYECHVSDPIWMPYLRYNQCADRYCSVLSHVVFVWHCVVVVRPYVAVVWPCVAAVLICRYNPIWLPCLKHSLSTGRCYIALLCVAVCRWCVLVNRSCVHVLQLCCYVATIPYEWMPCCSCMAVRCSCVALCCSCVAITLQSHMNAISQT